jgi:hypothetical protein
VSSRDAAKVERVVERALPREEPEHRSDRRRFLMWATMLNLVPSRTVVERIVAEIETETPRE